MDPREGHHALGHPRSELWFKEVNPAKVRPFFLGAGVFMLRLQGGGESLSLQLTPDSGAGLFV